MKAFNVNEALEFLNHQVVDNLLVPFFIREGLVVWAMETWIFFLSNWVLLVVVTSATVWV